MLCRLRLFRSDQRGTAAVEMALMLPLLILLMFGGLEVAHYLYVEHQVVKGVRDGARYAARMPFSKVSCAGVDATTESDIKDVTRLGAVVRLNPDPALKPRVRGWTNNEITVTTTCSGITTGIYKAMTGAPQVTVATTVPYVSLFGSLTGLDVDINMRASQQAAVMGV